MTSTAMDWRAIEAAFKGLVKGAIGLECVWGNSNGVQPDRSYVMLTWLGFDNISDSGSYDSFDEARNVISRNYYASRTAQVDVQAIAKSNRAGDNALAFVDALMVAFDMEALPKRWLAPVGIAVSDFTAARLLDAVEDGGRIVSRAAFTLKLNLAANVAGAETPTTIESVALTGNVSGLTGALSVAREDT